MKVQGPAKAKRRSEVTLGVVSLYLLLFPCPFLHSLRQSECTTAASKNGHRRKNIQTHPPFNNAPTCTNAVSLVPTHHCGSTTFAITSNLPPVNPAFPHATVDGAPCSRGTNTFPKLTFGSTALNTNPGFSSSMYFQHARSLSVFSAAYTTFQSSPWEKADGAEAKAAAAASASSFQEEGVRGLRIPGEGYVAAMEEEV